MKLGAVSYFEIQSSDPGRDKSFYAKLFGWKFVRQTLTPIEYYHIESPGIYGGLLKRPAAVPPPGFGTNAFVCSMQVEDFDSTSSRILELGGQIAMPKFAVPGRCWQGYFLDPDRNTFGIFEVDENAGK